MPTNQFVPFATAPGANAQTPTAYAAEPTRQTGNVAGTARSIIANTAWRQGSSVAAMIGQFIVEQAELDARDDGNISVLLNSFIAGLRAVAGDNTTDIFNDYSITGGRRRFITANETWTAPTGVRKVYAFGQAGGGRGGDGGGGAGAGGLGGNSFEGVFDVIPGQGYPVIIGRGGNIVVNGRGQTGGVTSFGSLATAKGGPGGGNGAPNGGVGIAGNSPGFTGIVFPNGGREIEGGEAQNGIFLAGIANIGGIGGGSSFSPIAPNPYAIGSFRAVGEGGGGSGGAGDSPGGDGGDGCLLLVF